VAFAEGVKGLWCAGLGDLIFVFFSRTTRGERVKMFPANLRSSRGTSFFPARFDSRNSIEHVHTCRGFRTSREDILFWSSSTCYLCRLRRNDDNDNKFFDGSRLSFSERKARVSNRNQSRHVD